MTNLTGRCGHAGACAKVGTTGSASAMKTPTAASGNARRLIMNPPKRESLLSRTIEFANNSSKQLPRPRARDCTERWKIFACCDGCLVTNGAGCRQFVHNSLQNLH